MKKSIGAIAGLLVMVIILAVWLGMWNSDGTLIDLIAGQFDPGPKQLERDTSAKGGVASNSFSAQISVDLTKPISTVAPEYISFAIDLSQVVGGKWWNPAANQVEMGSGTVHAPIFDFNRPQLDTLARALSPAYLRIGGSESDKVFYDLSGAAAPNVPNGYQSVMTAPQWDAVNAFAQRNKLNLVFTLNAGPAARDSNGSWNGENARELLCYTAQHNYPVALWELGNELNIFWFVHGLQKQVPVDRYRKDLQTARRLVSKSAPASRFAGQGSAFWPVLGEPLSLLYGYMPAYLAQSADLVDQVSWHYYPQQGRRGPIASRRAFPSRLLDPKNLDEVGYWADRIRGWRDQYAPGKPIWLSETGNAQFGGEPGLSDVYLSSLWWNDQLGLLATKGQSVVVRQTLSGSDYGMINELDLSPRPDYWSSLLWKRIMGTQVFAAKANSDTSGRIRVYAQSTAANENGAVTILVINLDPARAATVSFPGFANRSYTAYSFTAPDLFGTTVLLNGQELALTPDHSVPNLLGATRPASTTPTEEIHPMSYAFFVFPR